MPAIVLLSLLITAGVVALVLLWPRVHTSPAGARLVVELAATTFALSALVWGLLETVIRYSVHLAGTPSADELEVDTHDLAPRLFSGVINFFVVRSTSQPKESPFGIRTARVMSKSVRQ